MKERRGGLSPAHVDSCATRKYGKRRKWDVEWPTIGLSTGCSSSSFYSFFFPSLLSPKFPFPRGLIEGPYPNLLRAKFIVLTQFADEFVWSVRSKWQRCVVVFSGETNGPNDEGDCLADYAFQRWHHGQFWLPGSYAYRSHLFLDFSLFFGFNRDRWIQLHN